MVKVCPAPCFLNSVDGTGRGEVSDCFRVNALFAGDSTRGSRTHLPFFPKTPGHAVIAPRRAF